jgi:hypothetical protein
MVFTQSAHDGSKRKLIIAFDVGTTYSGVSYTCVQVQFFPWLWLISILILQDPHSGPGTRNQRCYEVCRSEVVLVGGV